MTAIGSSYPQEMQGSFSNVGTTKRPSRYARSSSLTFSRNWLIHISKETVQIAKDGFYTSENGKIVSVADALDNAKRNSVHYHSSHVFKPSETTKPLFESTEYDVQYGSSLEVATMLHESYEGAGNKQHIGILNSASGKMPEKFLRGTISQEESFCRASLLYPCLIQYKDRPHHFYHINQKPKYQESSSSCAIFCPRVPVIREDTVQGDLLDEFLEVSFTSIPAPNAFVLGMDDDEKIIPEAQTPGADQRNEAYSKMTLEDAMYDRVFRALSIFAEQGCTDLVLCAFGCGVHGNNPSMIANCFKSILTQDLKGRFRKVVFAIQPSRHANYDTFVEVFGNL